LSVIMLNAIILAFKGPSRKLLLLVTYTYEQ
jgi:hypothetical protein